jgi:hypothetical protein
VQGLRHLVVGVHRRSRWQIIASCLAGGRIALQIAGTLVGTAGLSPWFPGGQSIAAWIQVDAEPERSRSPRRSRSWCAQRLN